MNRATPIELLDSVVLLTHVPNRDLHAGDVGAVVDVYPGDYAEVEFLSLTGGTRALLMLPLSSLRKADAGDVLAARGRSSRTRYP